MGCIGICVVLLRNGVLHLDDCERVEGAGARRGADKDET